ncbi:MAG: MFS transporter [Alphaproteobacteria bacterium]|nr:MFS transporter [Alphaproteobacteria bacterium]
MPADSAPSPAPQETAAPGRGATFRILALIGTGHAVSNFYALCLPPLIPFFKAEFDVSYAALGAMLSLRSFMSGIMQVPMGIAVDKLGAKPVLVAGSVLMGASFGLIAVAPGYWSTVALLACLGAGMATLRPSNYAIINASIPRPWLGRAFGFNVFSAHAGRAVAPAAIIFLASLWDWRMALLIAGGTGIAITIGLITQWRHVRDDTKVERKGPGPSIAAQARMFASRGIVLFFAFYALTSFSMQGVLSFTVVAMTELGRAPLGAASGALTGYLIASALGVLAGGYLADKTSRHEMMAVTALLLSAGFLLALGTVSMPVVVIVAVMSTVGMCQGAMRPARDMLLRAILPREIFGRAIGLVSTGAAIGGTLSPVIFGWILDLGHPEWVFYILGVTIVLMAATVVAPKERIRLPG